MKKGGVLKISLGVGKYKVDLMLTQVGRDVVVVVSGGEKPHVGAVAMAVPRPSLKDATQLSSTSSVLTMIGHKDDEVARLASETLARELGKVVVVSAGIHTEKASKTDIQRLVRNSKDAVRKAVEILKRDLKQSS